MPPILTDAVFVVRVETLVEVGGVVKMVRTPVEVWDVLSSEAPKLNVLLDTPGVGGREVAETAVETCAVMPFSFVVAPQVRFPMVAPRLPPTLAATATTMDPIHARMKNVRRLSPRILTSAGAEAPAHTAPPRPCPAIYGTGTASLS
jgi:hypothetical protein